MPAPHKRAERTAADRVVCEWGEQFDIQVLQSDTIASWKEYVACHSAVPTWQQTWVFNGTELADGDRVRIPSSATITVALKGVHLEDDEPIGSFQLNSSTVQPEDTLHGLYEELHYEQKEMQEAVVLPPSDSWKWNAEVERLIACFKQTRASAQPRFVVYVRVVATDRTVVVAGVFDSCTMQKIKEVVEQLDGVPAESQRLFYGEKELKNECTLKEAEIKNEATLHSLGFITGSQLLRQVPRPPKRPLQPFARSAFGGVARQAEREFAELKHRLRALRELLVFAETDEELRKAVQDEYASIVADRKKAKEPQVDARLVDEWRRSVDELSDELRRTKIAVADAKLQLANRRRELEDLRRRLEYRRV
ncbi:Ubiquitin [Aphelenchoides fujianensis]|nr:Ubiquitin [Aphelenchoides fujianensis]